MKEIIEQHMRDIIGSHQDSICAHIESCINYLHSLNDVEFENIYIKSPQSQREYQDNMEEINANSVVYSYINYAHAYVSDIGLIRRCLQISRIPLWNSIKILTRFRRDAHKTYTNFNVESCKLLYENDCNVVGLLHIACNIKDYDSIRYLVNNMSENELHNLLHTREYIYLNLAFLLVVDRIMNMHDRCFIALLTDTIMTADNYIYDPYWIIPNMKIYNTIYFIIKYMTLDEGKKLHAKINNEYIYTLNNEYICNPAIISHVNVRDTLTLEQLLYNNLLEYYFRPRGSHTKGAVA
jgi:hypothetical protein